MKHLSLSDGFLREFSRAVAARAAGFSGRFAGWLKASRKESAA